MKGRYFVFALLGAFLAASFLCPQATAAEGDSGAAAKDTEKPKAESSEKDKSEGKADKEEEKPTLEGRLKTLQETLAKFAQKSNGMIPRQITQLVRTLPEKEKGLINPETGKQIKMNKNMAGGHSVTIRKPSEFITFYADKDTPKKGRAVVYGDGKVAYLPKAKFDKILKASVAKRLTAEERGMRMEAAREAARAERMAARQAAEREKKKKQNK